MEAHYSNRLAIAGHLLESSNSHQGINCPLGERISNGIMPPTKGGGHNNPPPSKLMNKEEYDDFRAEMEFSKSKERFLKGQKTETQINAEKNHKEIVDERKERYYRELNQRIDRQLKEKW